jgi:hypothetical protein
MAVDYPGIKDRNIAALTHDIPHVFARDIEGGLNGLNITCAAGCAVQKIWAVAREGGGRLAY